MNIVPSFGLIEPTQQVQLQNITCDEAGITADQADYTADGVSGASGRLPEITINNIRANIGITSIKPNIS